MRSLGWARSSKTGIPIRRDTERDAGRHGLQAQERNQTCQPLDPGLSLPEPWGCKFLCFKPPTCWSDGLFLHLPVTSVWSSAGIGSSEGKHRWLTSHLRPLPVQLSFYTLSPKFSVIVLLPIRFPALKVLEYTCQNQKGALLDKNQHLKGKQWNRGARAPGDAGGQQVYRSMPPLTSHILAAVLVLHMWVFPLLLLCRSLARNQCPHPLRSRPRKFTWNRHLFKKKKKVVLTIFIISHGAEILTGSSKIWNTFTFLFVFGQDHSMRKFLSQGLNPHHRSNNDGSLTLTLATRELLFSLSDFRKSVI